MDENNNKKIDNEKNKDKDKKNKKGLSEDQMKELINDLKDEEKNKSKESGEEVNSNDSKENIANEEIFSDLSFQINDMLSEEQMQKLAENIEKMFPMINDPEFLKKITDENGQPKLQIGLTQTPDGMKGVFLNKDINKEDMESNKTDSDENKVKNIEIESKNPNLNNNNNDKSGNENMKNSSNEFFENIFGGKSKKPKSNYEMLEEFGTYLNREVEEGRIDKVIGRDKEIERVCEILNRRSKNNPVLLGEPGVGKTAIAEGLAFRIVNGNVPQKLMNKKVYMLDMGSLVAGTQFRGQFEARVKGILNECKKNKDVILVIDELHTIMGTGDQENSTNAANLLKPALSRGEVQVIGATTFSEYKKSIEKDGALERRFQPVKVEEPNEEDTIEILKGIKKYYEDYHFVRISDDLIKQTVKMSEKYIHNRFLPDKAIDLIDEASSSANLKNTKLYELELVAKKLKEIAKEKEECVLSDSTEDYKKAAELKAKECALIEAKQKIEKDLVPTSLTIYDIARVVERWTKIPVTKLTEEEEYKLLHLEENIHKNLIGQNDAVKSISRAIRRNKAGLNNKNRPPSFLFVGPTGVGKTELAKVVADIMFGSRDKIIRVDMSEYMESHSVSKLIGSPPGYVGYSEAGGLTEKVRRNPYSIVLFDEIEKASPEVLNILLQVLDDGILTDSQGTKVNFSNTIIILTSNVGSTENKNQIGFAGSKEANKNKVMSAVRSAFRPEFLNRLDDIIVFESLNKEDLDKILELFISKTKAALKEKNIEIELSENLKEYIIKKGTDEKYGARPLRRAVEKYLEDSLSDAILAKSIIDGNKVFMDIKDEEIIVSVKTDEKFDEIKKEIYKNKEKNKMLVN